MSPSDRIELTLENIRAIARNQLSQAEGDAQQQRTTLRNLELPAGAFGGIPEAQAYGSRLRAVQDVFADVVEQVVVDVAEFRDNLLASVNAHESTDDAARATLMALGTQYRGRSLRSEQAYDRSRRDNADDLAPPPDTRSEGSEPATAGDGSAEPTTPAAPGEPAVADGDVNESAGSLQTSD